MHEIPIMGCKDDGRSESMNFSHKIENYHHIFLVEVTRWFIGEERMWFMDKCPSDSHSLTFTSGEMFGIGVSLIVHTHFCEEFTGTTSDSIFTISTDFESIGDIFCHSF